MSASVAVHDHEIGKAHLLSSFDHRKSGFIIISKVTVLLKCHPIELTLLLESVLDHLVSDRKPSGCLEYVKIDLKFF